MFGVGVYRHLLRLYPSSYRSQFSEEMVAVFAEMRAEVAKRGLLARGVFGIRETAGIFAGALQEHLRSLGGDPVWMLFPTRRFTMRTEFRFPKATAVLMTIILAGVMMAIKKGEAIVASVPNVSQPVGTIHPVHSVFLGGIILSLAFFYAAGLIGWSILFAMRRSGVHRLAATLGEPK